MNIFKYSILLPIISLLFITACNTTSPVKSAWDKSSDTSETLYVYEDGRMEYKSRFLNEDDVVIYNDGYGGEKAAIKVRVPIHSDFYRDSIVVVRVVNNFDEAISQNKKDKNEGVN